jgi:hypothetical protein
MSCTDVRHLVSERLDGEAVDGLDTHLDDCPDCTAFAGSAEAVRRGLRFEAVGEVPDIAGAVRARLEAGEGEADVDADVDAPTPLRRSRPTLAVAAAALVAGVLIGANLVGVGGDAPLPATAAQIAARVRSAQTAVDGLHEELRLVERGWNPAVPERTYVGTLDYRAPESMALVWQDDTVYPSGAWRPNDVTLRTDGEAWSTTGVPLCPSVSQPDCAIPPRERAMVGRPPFVDGTVVPLELIVPVRSFARVDTVTVVGQGEVAGRPTVEVTAVAAQVGPLLDGLAPAGNLRAVHPTDEVDLSLDAERMVPLRLRVVASTDPDRRAWAVRRGYADHAGLVVLDLAVTTIDLSAPPADRFVPPASDTAADAGFRPGPTGIDLDPVTPAGFTVNRRGRIEGATPTGVWSWSDGRAWIRLQATDAWSEPRLFGDLGDLVRAQPFGDGVVYLRPDGRRVGLHGADLDVVVDGSVGTDELLTVIGDVDVAPVELPADWPEHRQASLPAIRRALPGVLGLAAAGFERPVARLEGDMVVLVAVGAGARSLRLDQVPGDHISLPVEMDYVAVEVRGHAGRYAPGSGRLEWVEDGRVHVLRGTGLSRDELLAVAEDLTPL